MLGESTDMNYGLFKAVCHGAQTSLPKCSQKILEQDKGLARQKIGFNWGTCCHWVLRALDLGRHADWQAAPDPVLFWNSHSSNPCAHPAAMQSWTNMELNREIQSEYKQVMNNTLSILALTCNKNSHVFFSVCWERLFAWFVCAAVHNTAPLIVWITHYNVYSGPCEPSLFKFNTFGYWFGCWLRS